MSDPLFTEAEAAYLAEQRLLRLATARADGSRVDVAPLGFRFDGERFHLTGYDITKTMKYFHIRANPNVALVVDDLVSVDPWTPRGVKVHGTATIEETDGRSHIEITPTRVWSWGLEAPAFDADGPVQRRVER
ncbi:MAG: PPOX class F420-dependent oxidoreductase [Acidimicrobiales bacterium]